VVLLAVHNGRASIGGSWDRRVGRLLLYGEAQMTAPFDGRLLAGVSVLSAVIESGNFARAAEVLALSASGVSRAIARLESRVGHPLA
jgi:hypothetical protein